MGLITVGQPCRDLRESDANGFVQKAISAANVYNNIVKYVDDANITSLTTLNLSKSSEEVTVIPNKTQRKHVRVLHFLLLRLLISGFSPSLVLDGSADQCPPGAAGEAERQCLQGVCVFALGAVRYDKHSVCGCLCVEKEPSRVVIQRMPPPTGRGGVRCGRQAEGHRGDQRDDGEEYCQTHGVGGGHRGDPHQ